MSSGFAALRQIENALTFSGSDAKNLAAIVASYADFHGDFETKVNAISRAMDQRLVFVDDDSHQLQNFTFQFEGHTVMLSDIKQNSYGGTTYLGGHFVEYDDYSATCRVMNDGGVCPPPPLWLVLTADRDSEYYARFVKSSAKALARSILLRIQDGLCELCDQIVDQYNFHHAENIVPAKCRICTMCACAEMMKPCTGCKRRIGRPCNGDKTMHPACKRRRLAIE